MSPDFELVVPSRDGLPYAFIVAREYARLGLVPRYFIDDRSSRLFLTLAKACFAKTTVISPVGESIEDILPQIAEQTSAKWILRIDDDEVPSSAFMAWVTHTALENRKTIIAIPRRAVRFDDGKVVYARTIPKLAKLDYQHRGFVKEGARFDPVLHSPGIRFSNGDIIHAPDECCLYHFDWIVRTRSERDAKLARYEQLKRGSRSEFEYQYLPEDFAPALYDYAPLDDRRIVRLAKRLRRARQMQNAIPWFLSARAKSGPASTVRTAA